MKPPHKGDWCNASSQACKSACDSRTLAGIQDIVSTSASINTVYNVAWNLAKQCLINRINIVGCEYDFYKTVAEEAGIGGSMLYNYLEPILEKFLTLKCMLAYAEAHPPKILYPGDPMTTFCNKNPPLLAFYHSLLHRTYICPLTWTHCQQIASNSSHPLVYACCVAQIMLHEVGHACGVGNQFEKENPNTYGYGINPADTMSGDILRCCGCPAMAAIRTI
jgi:hypothetical protein